MCTSGSAGSVRDNVNEVDQSVIGSRQHAQYDSSRHSLPWNCGMFDTAIAARLLGDTEVGLQALVRNELGVELRLLDFLDVDEDLALGALLDLLLQLFDFLALAPDDDVVVNRDADLVQRQLHGLRHLDIVARGGGIAGRVVMRHPTTCFIILKCKHFF